MAEHEQLVPDPEYFYVFKRGKLTVIGFDAQHLADDPRSLHECEQMLLDVIEHNDCRILAVDLSELELVSSWVLAVLMAAHRKGIEVHLYRASRDIADVLQVTHLDELLRVRDNLFHLWSRWLPVGASVRAH